MLSFIYLCKTRLVFLFFFGLMKDNIWVIYLFTYFQLKLNLKTNLIHESLFCYNHLKRYCVIFQPSWSPVNGLPRSLLHQMESDVAPTWLKWTDKQTNKKNTHTEHPCFRNPFFYFSFYKLACYYIENFTFQTEHITYTCMCSCNYW